MRNCLLLLAAFLFLTSCSLQKRLYRDGFYVEKKHDRVDAVFNPTPIQENSGVATELCREEETEKVQLPDSVFNGSIQNELSVQPEDSARRKWFRKADRDTVPAEETPVRIETPSKRSRFAADAVLTGFLGIIFGFLLFIVAYNEWLAITIGTLLILMILSYIFLSVRAHRRYKQQEGETGKQTLWGVIGRFFLYAVALLGAAVIFNAFILWSIKDLTR